MSTKESAFDGFVEAVCDIASVDLAQAIGHVRRAILNGKTYLGFELYQQNVQLLRTIQHLIAAVPAAYGTESEEKGNQYLLAVENFIFDVCLPFLHSFTPSYDSRTELAAAVLNVSDLVHVCVKRSSPKAAVKILELCLQSVTAYHDTCIKHSESRPENTLDILCALELLYTTLDTSVLSHSNQNEDLFDRIFSAVLSILQHVEEKTSNRIVAFVILKLTHGQNQQAKSKHTVYLQEVWKFIEADVTGVQKIPARTLQQHLTVLCSMANYFFPLSEKEVEPDLRQKQTFWKLVQQGLYSDNPATRKRSMYLLKRIIDICEKSESDFKPTNSSSDYDATSVPHFFWSVNHQKSLSKIWEDALLLFETLDEKQTHVIKPILPRMQALISASGKKNGGSVFLHTSWIVTLLMRAFIHESVYIIRWAAETVLMMDFTSVPFAEQGQLQFLTKQLLVYLQDLKLHQRPEGSPVGSCSSIGTGLQHFFASVCQSLGSKEEKVEFMEHVLLKLREDNWSSVPLVFITQGLSCIAPDAILSQSGLTSIREIIIASLTTLESFTRGAIECFLTKTTLNLIDKSAVGIDDLMETLALMEREESMQRGTSLWSTIVTWVISSASDNAHPGWTWSSLATTLHTMIDSYLIVPPDAVGNVLAENLRVTKIGRLVMLMADCEDRLKGQTQDQTVLTTAKNGPLLTTVLGKINDIICNVNTRAYMPVLKTDRAISLLLACAKELIKGDAGKEDPCHMDLCRHIHKCWGELLVYLERRILSSGNEDEENSVDLDLVIFYTDVINTLGQVLPLGGGISSCKKLVDTCTKMLEPVSMSPVQQVAAMSFLESVAQVVDVKLKPVPEGTKSHGHEGARELSKTFWAFCSSMNLGCDNFPSPKKGGSSQHGRQVCQYMMSQWQCLRVFLSHQTDHQLAHSILDAALETFSVSSGEADIPIMQCLEAIFPQLVGDNDRQDKIVKVMQIAWIKVHEEIKSWSFWLKMEAFVNMILQPSLLMASSAENSKLGTFIAEMLSLFFEVGQEKSGLLNLVIGRLCRLWADVNGIELAIKMVPTIVDACMFGTLHKKGERLWLDVCMYIESLKEECSVNEILSSCSKNDLYVRLMIVNFLSTLNPEADNHKTLAKAVLQETWSRYNTLAQMPTFRQYSNSLPHRQKHRLVQVIPLLDRFIDQDCCLEFYNNAWAGLVLECHQSVRQNLEWLVMRLVQRYPHQLLPFFWQYFDQFSDKRNVSLLSLLHIVTLLGPELPAELQEDFYTEALPLVVPWTMAHHFNTRLHAQAAVFQLWKQCQQMQLQARQFKMVEKCVKFLMDNRNSSSVFEKLLDNYFFSHFDFLADYSMETLLYTLPRLACLADDEWMHPDLFSLLDTSWQTPNEFRLLPLYNATKTLASCEAGAWKIKATAETGEDNGESTEGDVQKKIIPWRVMTPENTVEQEYTCRKKGRKQDGLVLVTSLINKIPNLGGLCRTSEIFGVSEFVIGNLSYLYDRLFQSLSVTAEKWLPITEVQSFRLSEFLEEKKRESYTIVGVEQTANSVSLTDYRFPQKTLLVLGNEKEGIPPNLLQLLDVCVEIPQQGIIRSLNVHVSGALLVWEYTRQQMESPSSH